MTVDPVHDASDAVVALAASADSHRGVELSAEYEFCAKHAGLADLSPRGRLRVTGGDRVRFLHNTCTNDINKLSAGHGCEAFFLDAKGRILFYGAVFAGDDAHWIDADPGQIDALIKHLDRYIIREDVQLADKSASLAQLLLLGPAAAGFLSSCGVKSVAEFADLDHAACELAGVACQVRRHDRALVPGFNLLVPTEGSDAVRQGLLAAGGTNLTAIGDQTLEALRIEAGIPAAGREIGDDNIPQELGRDSQAISFTKGCYIGQETVARLDAMGHVNRMLRGLTYAAAEPAPLGAAIRLGEKTVGHIGSTAFSPRFDKYVGLAVVRAACQPDAEVLMDAPGGPINATVHALPMGVTRRSSG